MVSHMRVWLLWVFLCAAPLVAVVPDQEGEEQAALSSAVSQASPPQIVAPELRGLVRSPFFFMLALGGRRLPSHHEDQTDSMKLYFRGSIVPFTACALIAPRVDFGALCSKDLSDEAFSQAFDDMLSGIMQPIDASSENLDYSSMDGLFSSFEGILRRETLKHKGQTELLCETVEMTGGERRPIRTLHPSTSHSLFALPLPVSINCVDYVTMNAQEFLPRGMSFKNLKGLIIVAAGCSYEPVFTVLPDMLLHDQIVRRNSIEPFLCKMAGTYCFPRWLKPYIDRGDLLMAPQVRDREKCLQYPHAYSTAPVLAHMAGGLGWRDFDLPEKYNGACLPMATFGPGENPWDIPGVQPFKVEYMPDSDAGELSDPGENPGMAKRLSVFEECMSEHVIMPILVPGVGGEVQMPEVVDCHPTDEYRPLSDMWGAIQPERRGSGLSSVQKTLRFRRHVDTVDSEEGLEDDTYEELPDGCFAVYKNTDVKVEEEVSSDLIFESKELQELWDQSKEIADRKVLSFPKILSFPRGAAYRSFTLRCILKEPDAKSKKTLWKAGPFYVKIPSWRDGSLYRSGYDMLEEKPEYAWHLMSRIARDRLPQMFREQLLTPQQRTEQAAREVATHVWWRVLGGAFHDVNALHERLRTEPLAQNLSDR